MNRTPAERVDPDTNLARLKRAMNQFASETELLALANPLADRVIRIREKIFAGLANVWGRPAAEVLSPLSVADWPHKELERNSFWPAFEQAVHRWSQTVATSTEEAKELAALRLAVLVYFLGILIHPAVDGNGQTFRILALSFLRGHSRRYADRFLPIKYVQDYGKSLHIHPFSEKMIRDIRRVLKLEESLPEGRMKENILATLLTTEKGEAFCRGFLLSDLKLPGVPETDYEKTAAIFAAALGSLETDFQNCLDAEDGTAHAEKHAYILDLIRQGTLSLDRDFQLSEAAIKKISASLQAFHRM